MRDPGPGLQYECMRAGARFIFSANPNSAFAANRAFVLAHTTANAQMGIDVRLLQAYLNRYRMLTARWLFNWMLCVNC